ncbi:LOW QUALITY PROTEIN: gamma-tubulin complex component 3 [Anopheles bellator]|uniref:LOW QUALITY PROTEIN: gamma-tubulin complex component 3 n=1 Tax=Anopheles bellator TaxID=139047 RepID=UPI002648209D|nr:LOW QUALITY PROTEIN: gamma-tubulin complex component 3 [Anopheles bellator]
MTMMNRNNQPNFPVIYELLKQLCRNLAGERADDVLKGVTQLIANRPNSIAYYGSSASTASESSIVTRINRRLSSRSQASVNVFNGFYEELVSITESKQRVPILEFLLNLADADRNLAGASGLQIDLRNDAASSVGGPLLESALSKISLDSGLSGSCSSQRSPMLSVVGSSGALVSGAVAGNELEDSIIQDIIYACTGIEGKYLRKNVVTGEFKLDHVSGRHLDTCNAGMLLRLAEVGFFYSNVVKFTDPKSDSYLMGSFGQGYITALRKELTNYYGLIANLQEALDRQRQPGSDTTDRMTLVRTMVWLVEPMERLQWLSVISDACREVKGGALASAVHKFIWHGDPMVRIISRELLQSACIPLQQMLTQWLTDGKIVDPNCEFFIEKLMEVGYNRLWHDEFRLRISMVPSFISDALARQILVIGKSINFLREICKDRAPVRERNDLSKCLSERLEYLYSPHSNTELHVLIDNVYLKTSKRVLDIVLGPHRLFDHLQAMRDYLLLGQGHFADMLMEYLKEELDRPAKDIGQQELFLTVAEAVRKSSCEVEDPEVLNYLDVHFLSPCEGDTGWDVFCLTYKVQGPLGTIFQPVQCTYRALFKQLWNMKRFEYILASIWRNHMLGTRCYKPIAADIGDVMKHLQTYCSKMINLISQMQYYILFEVIECSWVQFSARVQQAKALDDVLEAHDKFLQRIRTGIFLDQSTHMFTSSLEQIFNSVRKLDEWQMKFYDLCNRELDSRKAFDDRIRESEAAGTYGVTAEQTLERDEELQQFEHRLSTCQKAINMIGVGYEDSVHQFLYQLAISPTESLPQLCMRLDYNEYYKHRDARLSSTLTFQHMRKSMAGNFGRK